ncbi:MAG: hypothetical protein R3A51_07860 [Nannocystaceae bacterium]|nr:hypothetical protein [Myxococcales bacterium]
MSVGGRINYFTDPAFLSFDNRAGILRSRGGTRMLGVSEDFLRGFVDACEYETGQATPGILRRCGEFFGRRLALWFERELSQHAGVSLRERAMIEFSLLIHDMWRGLGLGVLEIDWRRGDRGLIGVTLTDSAMSRVGVESHVGEDMFEGILEGFFANFCDGPVACAQTGDARLGDKSGTTFVITTPARVDRIRALRDDGASHEEVLEAIGG